MTPWPGHLTLALLSDFLAERADRIRTTALPAATRTTRPVAGHGSEARRAQRPAPAVDHLGAVRTPDGSTPGVGRIRPAVDVRAVTARRAPEDGIIRRLPVDEIHVGTRYRYVSRHGEGVSELVRVSGSWYTFADGAKVQGSANVHAAGAAVPAAVGAVPAAVAAGAGAAADDMDVAPDVPAAPEVSIAEGLLAAAGRLGIADDTLLSVLIQMTADEIRFLRETRGLFESFVATPHGIASCMESARALEELLAIGPVAASSAATVGDRKSLERTSVALGDALGRPENCLANITYGIHGFTVLCFGPRAEVVQSFAGADEPQTLAGNFRQPRTFGRDEMQDLLRGLACQRPARRIDAQTRLTGDVELEPAAVMEEGGSGGPVVYPNVPLRWVVREIPTADVVLARVVERIRSNLRLLPGRR